MTSARWLVIVGLLVALAGWLASQDWADPVEDANLEVAPAPLEDGSGQAELVGAGAVDRSPARDSPTEPSVDVSPDKAGEAGEAGDDAIGRGIRVSVQDAAGEMLAGSRVSLAYWEASTNAAGIRNRDEAHALTNDRGFAILRVPGGSSGTVVLASPPSSRTDLRWKHQQVHSGEREVRLVLPSEEYLRGRVVLPSGETCPGARVLLRRIGASDTTGYSCDSSGRFEIRRGDFSGSPELVATHLRRDRGSVGQGSRWTPAKWGDQDMVLTVPSPVGIRLDLSELASSAEIAGVFVTAAQTRDGDHEIVQRHSSDSLGSALWIDDPAAGQSITIGVLSKGGTFVQWRDVGAGARLSGTWQDGKTLTVRLIEDEGVSETHRLWISVAGPGFEIPARRLDGPPPYRLEGVPAVQGLRLVARCATAHGNYVGIKPVSAGQSSVALRLERGSSLSGTVALPESLLGAPVAVDATCDGHTISARRIGSQFIVMGVFPGRWRVSGKCQIDKRIVAEGFSVVNSQEGRFVLSMWKR